MGFSRNFPDPPVEDNGNSRGGGGVLKMKIWKIPGGLCLKLENFRWVIIEDNEFPWNYRGAREKMVWNSRGGGGGGVKNEIEFQGGYDF